ncbi:unnamed protein product [Cunninghamella blakesleeana]
MDTLPTEILENIFIRLSQRNKTTCLIVCKKWNDIISYEPSFYSTIEVHSLEQLKKCLHYGKETLSTNNTNNINITNNNNNNTDLLQSKKKKPFNQLVQHIKSDMIYVIDKKTLIDLVLTFPCIQSMTGFVFYSNKKDSHLFFMHSSLPSLPEYTTSLSLWYTKGLYKQEWMTTKLLTDHDKLTSLDFFIDVSLMLIDDITNTTFNIPSIYLLSVGPIQEKIITSMNDDIDGGGGNDDNDDWDIDWEDDLSDDDNDDEDSNGSDIDGDQVHVEIINFQSRVLKIQPILNKLTKLTIRFDDYFTSTMTTIYDIDERTLESIHQSCPYLESLILHQLFMNISDDYIHHHSVNDPLYQQNHILNSLEIIGTFHDPLCYTYLSFKYKKSLTFLKLTLTWESHLTENELQLIQHSFYDMIMDYPLLTHLSFHFNNWNYLSEPHFLPTKKFILWLRNDATQQLNYLSIPFPLSDLESLEPNPIFNKNNNNNNKNNNDNNNNGVDDDDDDDEDEDDDNDEGSNIDDSFQQQQLTHQKKKKMNDHDDDHDDISFMLENDDIKKMILQNDYLNYLKQSMLAKKAADIMKNRQYLNHLKSFTFTISENINNELNYLLGDINQQHAIVSNTIEELEIYDIFIKNASGFYIYLWLDIFPNLNHLKLKRLYRIKDYIDEMDQTSSSTLLNNNNNNNNNTNKNNIYDYYLKRKKEKQQQSYGLLSSSTSSLSSNQQYQLFDKYKLKTLDIQKCHLFFIDGFNFFFKKCPQLTNLTLVNNTYYHTDWLSKKDEKEVMEKNSIDISHLHLNRLVMINMKYASWLKINDASSRTITKLMIYEQSLKKQYPLYEENPYSTNHEQSNVNLYLRKQDQVYFDRYTFTPKNLFIEIETIPASLTIQSQSIDHIIFYNDYTFHQFYTR